MACDCKANRQIYELGRKYGLTVNKTRMDDVKGGVWEFVQRVLLFIFASIVSPVLLLIIIYKAFVRGDKAIHVDKMVGLNRN